MPAGNMATGDCEKGRGGPLPRPPSHVRPVKRRLPGAPVFSPPPCASPYQRVARAVRSTAVDDRSAVSRPLEAEFLVPLLTWQWCQLRNLPQFEVAGGASPYPLAPCCVSYHSLRTEVTVLVSSIRLSCRASAPASAILFATRVLRFRACLAHVSSPLMSRTHLVTLVHPCRSPCARMST